jgi:hypothetical protein
MKDALIRSGQGLPLQPWHLNARVDILKISCPMATRLLVSGAHNATARLVRETTVAEVMEMLYLDSSVELGRDDLHQRIKRALECSGVNSRSDRPVCSFTRRVA